MEYEGIEQEILLEPENAIVSAVYSVNGKTGDVVLTTSDLENDSDYQTGDEVDAAIATAIAGKQDTLTAGNNIQISDENVISATDTTYSAGNGLNLSSENAFSVDMTVVATQQNLATEVQNRENADNALQAQIDGISASSDVVDIVGTYADLQNYDTQHLKDNDIIKVLQDETQNDATTYYRWSTTTETFTLIGQEGPYYTKSAADAQFVPQTRTVNGKALSSNITLNASDVSALGTSDVVQTTGTSTSQVMSQNATTQALGTKLNITDYVVDDELKNSTNPVQNGVLYGLLGNMPTDFFSGAATSSDSGTELQFNGAIMVDDVQLNGDTTQQTYSGKNLLRAVTSASTTTGGVTFTVNADGTITANGTAATGINFYPAGDANYYSIPAGTYTLSDGLTNPTSTTYFTYIDGGTTYWWNTSDGRVTQNAPEGATIRPRIVIREGQTLNNVVFKLQLESGSTATSFEPYVGGIASPNPDYPQDIQVVTGEQTVNVYGKNLYNSPNRSQTRYDMTTAIANNRVTISGTATRNNFGGTYFNLDGTDNANANYYNYDNTTSGITLAAGTYTLSLNNVTGSYTTPSLVQMFVCAVYSGSYPIPTLATITLTNDQTSATFTIAEETTVKIQFRVQVSSDTSVAVPVFNNYSFDLQLEAGNSATSYQAYITPQTYTINLGSTELVNIDGRTDRIYRNGENWYISKRCAKFVFDGSENWGNTGINSYGLGVNIVTIPTTIVAGNNLAKSDHFVFAWNYNNPTPGFYVTSSSFVFISKYTTKSDWIDWLGTNNVTAYAISDPSTDTQITDAALLTDLNAFANAPCFDGQTNIEITASGTNLPAPLDVTVANANAQGIIYKLRNS